jgi:hypothetical protein
MTDPSSPTARSRAGTFLTLAGGLFAITGLFLRWGEASAKFRGGSVLGQEIPSQITNGLAGRTGHISFAGTADWTGLLAGVASGAVVVIALLLLLVPDASERRLLGALAALGGVAAALATTLAFAGLDQIARDEFLGQARHELEQIGGNLGVLLGGLLDRVLGEVIDLFEIKASAGPGLLLTLSGAVAAAIGGLLLAVPTRRRPRLESVLAGWDPAARAELRDALSADAGARAAMVERFSADPAKQRMAALVDDLGRDDAARNRILEALGQVESAAD